jgi:hypothetical protein
MPRKDKDEQREYDRKYYLKNKKKRIAKANAWNKSHQTKVCQRTRLWRKQNPWLNSYYHLRKRCLNRDCRDYRWYGGRGIKCKITKEEVKRLWFRDKAYEMKQPSIDRKDSKKHYTYDNCRFIELRDNVIKRNQEYNNV